VQASVFITFKGQALVAWFFYFRYIDGAGITGYTDNIHYEACRLCLVVSKFKTFKLKLDQLSICGFRASTQI